MFGLWGKARTEARIERQRELAEMENATRAVAAKAEALREALNQIHEQRNPANGH